MVTSNEFPDYLTQGESVEELQENLRDLTSGEIPGIRRRAGFSLRQGLQSLFVQRLIEPLAAAKAAVAG